MLRRLVHHLSAIRRLPSGHHFAEPRRQGAFRPSLEPLESRLVPSSVPLHVAGNHLKDPANNTVVLRGVNVISLEWRFDGANIPQAVDTAIHDWHSNLLRLPVNQDFWF